MLVFLLELTEVVLLLDDLETLVQYVHRHQNRSDDENQSYQYEFNLVYHWKSENERVCQILFKFGSEMFFEHFDDQIWVVSLLLVPICICHQLICICPLVDHTFEHFEGETGVEVDHWVDRDLGSELGHFAFVEFKHDHLVVELILDWKRDQLLVEEFVLPLGLEQTVDLIGVLDLVVGVQHGTLALHRQSTVVNRPVLEVGRIVLHPVTVQAVKFAQLVQTEVGVHHCAGLRLDGEPVQNLVHSGE
mmetsp:Transcript_114472/g.246079  ORF Transcript_114472/g.246079 Transcript_114472/m.246079 type:complete len:247 (-) Transcript_114472:268-1008(-)